MPPTRPPRPTLHEPRATRAEKTLVVVAIVVLAFNLRPAAVSVGPVLDEISTDLAMSPTTAGVLTTLPVLAFALFGAAAPALARRWGTHRVTLLAVGAVVVGLGGRAVSGQVPAFLSLSLLGLSGMAAANVLLPSLVKLHFPRRVGLLTSLYTTSLAIGLTTASAVTVPVAELAGTWRWGLGVWAVTAALATAPWLALLWHRSGAGGGEPGSSGARTDTKVSLRAVAHTRLGWAMAVLFGLQSMQAYAIFGWFAQVYRDAGFAADTAGLLLGLVTGMSIPLSFVLPAAVARMRSQGLLVAVLVACYVGGYLGLILAPRSGAVLWALLVGAGTAIFPVVLTLIGLRSRTGEGTAALSGFTQSVGYLMAALGPFGVGVLHDLSGGWVLPLAVLLALLVPQLLVGLAVARPAYLEDQLR